MLAPSSSDQPFIELRSSQVVFKSEKDAVEATDDHIESFAVKVESSGGSCVLIACFVSED